MTIFWRLIFGHYLSDFTLQSNFINRWKRSSFWGMVVHCATHPVICAIATWPYLNDVWLDLKIARFTGWACLLIVFIGHFAEDYWRVFTIFEYQTPDNTLYFVWDQIVHYAVIFAVAPLTFAATRIAWMPEKWPVWGALFVLTTHASTVFIYYVEKDLYGREYPHDREKYIGIVERLVLASCLLIPGHFWPLLALAWIAVMHTARQSRKVQLSWPSFYIGALAAILCGFAARMIYYA
jgi:hypothetical protein